MGGAIIHVDKLPAAVRGVSSGLGVYEHKPLTAIQTELDTVSAGAEVFAHGWR